MQRFFIAHAFTSCFILAWALCACDPLAAQKSDYPVFELKNKISKLTDGLDILTLKPKGGRLLPEFESNSSKARTEFQAAIRRGGAMGGMSSTSSGTTWSLSNTGGAIQVAAGYGKARFQPFRYTPRIDNSEESFWMKLVEPTSSLTVRAGDDKSLMIRLENHSGSELFQFTQDENGRVNCIEVGMDSTFSGSAANFDLLTQTYPAYVEKRLTPIFKFAGLGTPPNTFGGNVRQYVLGKLRPKDESRMEEFKEMIEAMNAESYQQRQAATKLVEEKADDWLFEIERAIADVQFDSEVRSRLKKIYDKRVSEVDRANVAAAEKSNLDQDQRYLVWLLERLNKEKAAEEDCKLIASQLEKLTSQAFGNEPAKWRSWLNENSKEKLATSSDPGEKPNLMAAKGELDNLTEGIQQLIRIKVVDGELKFDRDVWSESFGGKSVKELSDEVKEFIKERNLPEDWFQPGGSFPIETTNAPQMIFQRITEELEMDEQTKMMLTNYRQYQINTLNRSFDGTKLIASFEMHPNGRQQRIIPRAGAAKQAPPKEEFALVKFRELDGSRRELKVREDKAGNFMLDLRFGKENSLVRLVRTARPNDQGDQCFLFVLQGDAINTMKKKNFAALRASNEDYFKNEFDPLLKKLGIEIK